MNGILFAHDNIENAYHYIDDYFYVKAIIKIKMIDKIKSKCKMKEAFSKDKHYSNKTCFDLGKFS